MCVYIEGVGKREREKRGEPLLNYLATVLIKKKTAITTTTNARGLLYGSNRTWLPKYGVMKQKLSCGTNVDTPLEQRPVHYQTRALALGRLSTLMLTRRW